MTSHSHESKWRINETKKNKPRSRNIELYGWQIQWYKSHFVTVNVKILPTLHLPLIIALTNKRIIRSILLVSLGFYFHFFSTFFYLGYTENNIRIHLESYLIRQRTIECSYFNFPLVCFALWKCCHCVQHFSILAVQKNKGK